MYDAFISYSHDVPAEVPEAIQRGLRQFARPWHRRQALRVFRDRTGLSAGPGLWPAIEKALRSSRHLIVLASPGAARSAWVEREIRWWLANKSIETLHLVLVEGTIRWDDAAGDFDFAAGDAVPGALAGAFRDEPLWIDLGWAGGGDALSLRHARFRSELAGLAAPLHGRSKDELDGEDVRQHRRTRRLAAAVIAGLTVLTVLSATLGLLARRQRNLARAEQYAAQSDLMRDTRPPVSQLLAVRAWRSAQTTSARSVLLNTQSQAYRTELPVGNPSAVAFGTDPRLMAVATGDGRVQLFDPAERRLVADLTDGMVLSGRAVLIARGGLAFSRDGRLLAAGDSSGQVRVWQVADRRLLRTLPAIGKGAPVQSVAFGRDAGSLAVAYLQGAVLWNAFTGRRVTPIGPADARYVDLAWSADGAVLYNGGGGAVRPWRLRDRRLQPALPGFTGGVYSVAVSRDGKWVAAAGSAGVTWIWTARSGAFHGTVAASNQVNDLEFAPSGSRLALGDIGGALTFVDPATLTSVNRPVHNTHNGIQSVAYAPDGLTLATAANSTVTLWDPSSGAVPGGLEDAKIAFSPDQKHLAIGTTDGAVEIWDLARRAKVGSLPQTGGPVTALAYYPDGTVLWAGDFGGQLRITKLQDGVPEPGGLVSQKLTEIDDIAIGAAAVFVSAAGAPLLVFADSTDFQVPNDPNAVTSVGRTLAYSADGDLLAVGAEEGGSVQLWDYPRRTPIGPPLDTATAAFPRFTFSPDGGTLAVAGADGQIEFFTAQAQAAGSLAAHTGLVHAVAYSPDGTTLLTGGSDGLAKLWDATGRHESRAVLSGNDRDIVDAEYSSDGDYFATSGSGGVRVWNARPDAVIATICRDLDGVLTGADLALYQEVC